MSRLDIFWNGGDDPHREPWPDNFYRLNCGDWLSRERWVVSDASMLMAGVDPNWTHFTPSSNTPAHDSTREWRLLDAICQHIKIVKPSDQPREKVVVSFMGELAFARVSTPTVIETFEDLITNTLHQTANEIAFPVSAYYSFALRYVFPVSGMGADVPVFGVFHDCDKELSTGEFDLLEDGFYTCDDLYTPEEIKRAIKQGLPSDVEHESRAKTETPKIEPLAVENDGVICEGLTVADIRRLADKDNPCHAPELFEALKAWAYVSTHPHDGFTVKQALENEIKEVYSGTRARERITGVANWETFGKKNT